MYVSGRTVLGGAMLVAMLFMASSCATRSGPQHASSIAPSWTTVSGAPSDPLSFDQAPATVLLFIAPDCPISNGYAPEIARIANTYSAKGVCFFGIPADARVSAETAERHAKEYGFDFPVVLDPQQEIAHHVGATITPQAAVLDRK